MKSCKNNLKALWAICPVILMLLILPAKTHAYQAFFLRNTEFTSDLGGWFTAYENSFPYHSANFGTVEWSNGNAHFAVSGSPGVADLISFIGTVIYPGDEIKCRVTTSTMNSATFCLAIGGEWQDFSQVVTTTDASTTKDLVLVANKFYEPGTSILLHLVCWPGSGEAWVDNVELIRGN